MSDWPIPVIEPLVTVHTYSLEAVGCALQAQGNSLQATVSTVWSAANRAIFIPFVLSRPVTARRLFVENGAVGSGNGDMGIYDVAGVRLVSIGSTAQTGPSVLQYFDITDTVLGPGTFYLAVAIDNTTATTFATATTVERVRAVGAAQQETAFALPAIATLATIVAVTIPICGLTTRTV